jgi:hypothetical protein
VIQYVDNYNWQASGGNYQTANQALLLSFFFEKQLYCYVAPLETKKNNKYETPSLESLVKGGFFFWERV